MIGEKVFRSPNGLVAIETEDCNAVIERGAGGVDPLPVFQWGDGDAKYVRVAYPMTSRLKKFLRTNQHVILTVVIKNSGLGLEEISARLQPIRLIDD